jgi:hypothetical protein
LVVSPLDQGIVLFIVDSLLWIAVGIDLAELGPWALLTVDVRVPQD